MLLEAVDLESCARGEIELRDGVDPARRCVAVDEVLHDRGLGTLSGVDDDARLRGHAGARGAHDDNVNRCGDGRMSREPEPQAALQEGRVERGERVARCGDRAREARFELAPAILGLAGLERRERGERTEQLAVEQHELPRAIAESGGVEQARDGFARGAARRFGHQIELCRGEWLEVGVAPLLALARRPARSRELRERRLARSARGRRPGQLAAGSQ